MDNRGVVVRLSLRLYRSLILSTLGLPDDIDIQYVYPDSYGRSLALILTSERFPETAEGSEFPNAVLTIESTTHEVDEHSVHRTFQVKSLSLADGTEII